MSGLSARRAFKSPSQLVAKLTARLRLSRVKTLRAQRKEQGALRNFYLLRKLLKANNSGGVNSFARLSNRAATLSSQQNLPLTPMNKLVDGNWNDRRQRAVAYLKSKKAEYTRSLGDEVDEYEKSSSREPIRLNQPFKDERLTIYPSYSCPLRDGEYEVEVRGWLYLPGEDNRKSRLVYSLARQLSKPSSQLSSPSQEDGFSAREDSLITLLGGTDGSQTPQSDNDSNFHSYSSSSSRQSSFSSYSLSEDYSARLINDKTLKYRISGFLAKAATNRKLSILVGADQGNSIVGKTVDQLVSTDVITNSAGRFSTRIAVPYKPSFLHVVASDEVSVVEDIINIGCRGVSIISDVDDTIRHTGVTGDKREMFRNVFVRDYKDVIIDGISHWYKCLERMGVQFHYVSNSPWQLVNVITDYLAEARLPRGSIHLKHYSGLLTGLLEPAVEKKKPTLQAILRDFPHRKFILIGDSGERDLETYVDIACEFPNQILAIYIRDITLPLDDKTMLNTKRDLLSGPMSEPLGEPIQDDCYLSNFRRTTGDSSISRNTAPLYSQGSSNIRGNSLSNRTSMPRQIRSARRNDDRVYRPSMPRNTSKDLIDLTSDTQNFNGNNPYYSSRSVSKNQKLAPPVPAKPDYLRSNLVSKEEMSLPPPLPRRPRSSRDNEPVVMPSSQEDIDISGILDKKVEDWKSRVLIARKQLPPGIKLRMWRNGYDMEHECIQLVNEFIS